MGKTLEDIFSDIAKIHQIISDDEPDGRNFLTLECLGSPSTSDRATWAACFDAGLDPEWYEHYNIQDYATACRATSPAAALTGAIEKFYRSISVEPNR